MDRALRVTDQAQASTHTPLAYRPDIDGLRAVAIVCVMAFHAFPEIATGGFVGVDVFFVISGFLISSIILKGLRRGEFSFVGFYAGRVRRLLPSLCLVLIALLVAGWYFFLPDEFGSLGKNVLAGIAFVSNFVLWQESGYFDAAAESKPLLHLWSLGIEEQFYIAWPFVLYLAWKRGINAFRMSLALVVASFAINAWLVHRDPVSTFYLPVTRFWEILAGSLLALVNSRTTIAEPGATIAGEARPRQPLSERLWTSNLKAVAGLALLLIAVAELDKGVPYPGYWAVLPVCATMLMISAGQRSWLNRRVLSHAAMVWVGLVSYALYLWHWPVLVFLRLGSVETPSARARFAALVASFILAWLTYELVDKPVRYGSGGARKVLALCMIAIGVAGTATYRLQGVPSRFSDNLAKLANFQYDYHADYRYGTCFLGTDQGPSDFENCSNALPRPGARSIVLWGDSHAAHLYPGFKASLEANFKLTQLTASSCPPIVGLDVKEQPKCRAINDYVLQRIGVERPDRVILAAFWNGGYDSSRIVDTIRALREQGIPDIELVGPVPQWKDGLPRVLYREAQRDSLLHRIPQRTRSGLVPEEQLDATMRELGKAQGVTYLSPWDTLCDAEGCLTLAGSGNGVPIAWDTVHLTAEGSRFLVSHFPAAALAP